MRLEHGNSAEGAPLQLAIALYTKKDLTLGQAAEVAGLSQADFQRELGARRIPINYTMEDLESDLQTVRELTGK